MDLYLKAKTNRNHEDIHSGFATLSKHSHDQLHSGSMWPYNYSITTWVLNTNNGQHPRVFNFSYQNDIILNHVNKRTWRRTWKNSLDYRSLMYTVNKCEENHHWCQWFPRCLSTIRQVWINDLKSNTGGILHSRANDVNPWTKTKKLAIEACNLLGTKVVSRLVSWIMIWSRQEQIRRRRAMMNPTSTTRNRS